MALLYLDGFDYSNSTDLLNSGWSWNGIGTVTIDTTGGRFGTGALKLTPGNFTSAISPNVVQRPTGDSFMLHAGWFRGDAKPSAASGIIFPGNVTNGMLGITTNGFFGVGPSVSPIYSMNVCDNNWHWVEWYLKFSGTQDLRLYIDGILAVPTLAWAPSNQTDFRQQQYTLGQVAGMTNIKHDDIFCWNNTTGTEPGELVAASIPIGPKRIRRLYPTSAGSSTGWTPLSGNNWDNVEETSPDDDTTYVSTTGGSGTKDTYTFGDLAATDTNPLCTVVKLRGKNNSVSSSNISGVAFNVATTRVNADSAVLQNSWQTGTHQYPIYKDPNTSAAWTASGVNSAEFGFQIT